MRGGGAGGAGGGGGGAGLTGFACIFGTGFRAGAFREAPERDGLADLAERLDAWSRFFAPRAARAGLRVEVVRALVARRNFAMPGG